MNEHVAEAIIYSILILSLTSCVISNSWIKHIEREECAVEVIE